MVSVGPARRGAAPPEEVVRVLLVEDTGAHATLFERALAHDERSVFEIDHCRTLHEAIDHLRGGEPAPDVIVLDLGLPDSSGVDTVHALFKERPPAPIIVMTVSDDTRLAVRALSAGAEDYIVKGPDEFERIPLRLRNAKTIADSRRSVASYRQNVAGARGALTERITRNGQWLRTRVDVLRGTLRLLRAAAHASDVELIQRKVDDAWKVLDSMEDVVDDLMVEAERAGSGTDREPVNVGALVEEVARATREVAHMRPGDAFPVIVVRPALLKNALMRIVRMAAGPPAQSRVPEVEVVAHKQGDGWTIDISGPGRPEHTSGPTAAIEHLEMATCRTLIEAEGGDLAVQRGEHGASTFTLTFPNEARAETEDAED